MSNLNIKCEVHIPKKVAKELKGAIDQFNNIMPDEYEILSIKTRGGVIVKKEDLEPEIFTSSGLNLG